VGTSVAQIDATYGHLLPDSEDYLRGLLDDYDVAVGRTGVAVGGQKSQTPRYRPSQNP
jgi:hypothetical protein